MAHLNVARCIVYQMPPSLSRPPPSPADACAAATIDAAFASCLLRLLTASPGAYVHARLPGHRPPPGYSAVYGHRGALPGAGLLAFGLSVGSGCTA